MFYTGNEGPVDAFWSGNGFMMEMAESWGGLIVFGEERYYGPSIPSSDYSYMSTQQVLEDYVELLEYVKKEYKAESCPVIAFGGSYGGTLTTFFRAGKFNNVDTCIVIQLIDILPPHLNSQDTLTPFKVV